MEHWYAVDGQRFGPFSDAQFAGLLPHLPSRAWVWQPGDGRWVPLVVLAQPAPGWQPPPSWQPPPAGAATMGYSLRGHAPVTFAPAAPTSGMAVLSFCLALVSIPTAFFLVGVVFSVAAVVLGHLALRDMGLQEPGAVGGRGLAVAGLVVGYLTAALVVLLVVLVALLPAATPPATPTGPLSADAAVQTDLRNAATAMEVAYVEDQEYPQSLLELKASGFAPTSGAEFVISASGTGYCISAFRANATTIHIASTGGLGEGPCPEQVL